MKHLKILSVLAIVTSLTVGSVAAYAQTDPNAAPATTKTTTHKKSMKKKHKTTTAPKAAQ